MGQEDKPDKGPLIGATVGTVLLLEKLGAVPTGFALFSKPGTRGAAGTLHQRQPRGDLARWIPPADEPRRILALAGVSGPAGIAQQS